MDVYRKMTLEDFDEFRGFRGNDYKTQVRDEEGLIAEKDTLGHIQWREVNDEEAFNRRNYNTADNKNYLDGDLESSIDFLAEDGDRSVDNSNRMYEEGDKGTEQYRDEKGNVNFPDKYVNGAAPTYRGKKDMQTMVDNRARVYKGGGWKDRAYWTSPGSRRFLDEMQSRDDLGFRCAMHRVGGSSSQN